MFELFSNQKALSAEVWLSRGRFAALLALMILATYPQVLLGSHTFVFRDFGLFGYPVAHYYRECLGRGELPLWNALNHCGVPFLAQWNTLVLYPGSLFYLLLPLSWSLGIFCLAHLFLAGMGMYELAWRWTGNRLAAAVAGTAFAFNGLMLNSLMWPNNIAALGWMPWVVLGVERAWRHGGQAVILAALIGTLQMLAGAPEIILFTWFFLACMAACQWICGEIPRRLLPGRMGLVVLLIAGLAAAQLIPFFDLLAHSQRSREYADAGWSMPGWGWANLLVPLFHSFPTRQGVFFQPDQFWTTSYYLGIGPLLLAVWGAWRVRRSRVWLLAALAVLGLILALGDDGYLYRALRHVVPGLGFVRFPVKFVVLTVFTVPLLAAYGIAGEKPAPRQPEADAAEPAPAAPFFTARRIGAGWAVVGGLIGAVLWLAYRYPFAEDRWEATWTNGLGRLAFLALSLGTLCLLGRLRRRQITILLQLTLLALLWLDVLTHTPPQNPTVDRAVFDPNCPHPSLVPVPRIGEGRVMLSAEAERNMRRVFVPDPFNNYLCHRIGLFADCNLLDNVPKVAGFFSLCLREEGLVRSCLYVSTNLVFPRLADFMAVSHLTARGQSFDWMFRPSFMPVITAGQNPLFASDVDTLRAITAPDFDPKQQVYLPLEAKPILRVRQAAPARVKVDRFAAQRIDLEVEANAPAMVTIAQSFYHPWRAYVDGQSTRLWRANYAFQALEVPAGSHHVRLVYEDWSFKLGVLISAAALAICCMVWLKGRRPATPMPNLG